MSTAEQQHERRQSAEVRRLHEAHEAEVGDANEHARFVSARGLVQRGREIAQARHQAQLAEIDRQMDLLEVRRALAQARGAGAPWTDGDDAGHVPDAGDSEGARSAERLSSTQKLRARAKAVGVTIYGKSNPQLRREVETEERRQGVRDVPS